MKRKNVPGTIYLLCSTVRVAHARHYVGWTERDVAERIAEHLAGRGSPLVRAFLAAGGEVLLVRTWANVDRHQERRFKKLHGAAALCPRCKAARTARQVEQQRERRARARAAVAS